jgi:hypothetical protein
MTHRLPDLSPSSQAVLVCAIAIALALALTRGMIALHRHQLAVPHRYPASWTSSQIRFLEHVRLSIGIALIGAWVCLLISSPAMPQSEPFGLTQVALTIALLLLTNAWVLLVIPLDWQHTFVGRMNFDRAACFILLWWTILLGASMFAIVQSATEAAERPVYVIGTYA